MKTKVNISIFHILENILIVCCLFAVYGCKEYKIEEPYYSNAYATSYNKPLMPFEKNNKVLAEINSSRNFSDDSCFFVIDHDQKIRIIAFGEGADFKIFPTLIESYDNDGIEVYFDMKNEKFPYFNFNGDDRQYRILWNLLSVDGQNINTQGIEISQADPTKNMYIMELKFPWTTLGFIKPEQGTKIGFDIGILDNDGQTREALCTWYSNDSESWKNTSSFGTLILSKPDHNRLITRDAKSIKTEEPPVIDGKIDNIWNSLNAYECNNVIIGKLDNNEDINGYFKTCWNEENLYLLVCVNDDKKSYANVLFDYGWIEDIEGNIIWKMEMSKTKHSGGGLKNRYTDTLIVLRKGEYYLRYQTDESNCPENWDVEPSKNSFYGIKMIQQ
jgi:hypothetical protein